MRVVELGTSRPASQVFGFQWPCARPAANSTRTTSTRGRIAVARENFKRAGVKAHRHHDRGQTLYWSATKNTETDRRPNYLQRGARQGREA